MPILSGDVKLLKSAVMADVPEGGGAPTGVEIPDGVSNAIFPDVSELDRAGGRVNLRKVLTTSPLFHLRSSARGPGVPMTVTLSCLRLART